MTPRCTHPPRGAAARAARAHRAPLPRIETERLVLRAPDLADLPAWTEIYLESFDKGGGAEDAWTEFSYYTAGWLLHGHGLWTAERKNDAETLGFVLLGLEWADAEPELGWMFLPRHRGRGYATEAATAARDHGLALFGPGGLVSYIAPSNAPSLAVAARLKARRDTRNGSIDCQTWRHGGSA